MSKAMYPPNVINAFNGMTGELTRADIDASIPEDCSTCPIARALSRIVGLEVAVSDNYAEIYRRGEVVLLVGLSQEIMDWTLNFDEGQPVQPIQLILRQIGKQWLLQKTYAEQTPIAYHPVPESVEVFVTFENDEPFGTQWTGAISENGRLDYVVDGGGRHFFTMEELYAHGVRHLHISNGHEVAVEI